VDESREEGAGSAGRWTRVVLLLVPILAVAGLVVGSMDPAPEGGGTEPDPEDRTAPGVLRVEIGGEPTGSSPAVPPADPGGGRRPSPPPPDPDPEPATWHTVVEGDTLTSLAEHYYGDASRWVDIQRANGLESDVIVLGEKLRIP
jgi:nucleoid-associated protein YgaU